MYIIEVTPFSKTIRTNSLSYFSSQEISIGSIVSISIRNKNIKGLVTKIRPVKDLKSELKSFDYTLKKIKGVSKNILFSTEFLNAVDSTANYFATSSGSIIKSLVPENILESIDKIKKVDFKKQEENSVNKENKNKLQNIEDEENTKKPKYILQTEDKDRYSEYKSIIREQFAKNKSVLFFVPTIEDGNYATEELSRGIEKHTFVLNSKISKTELIKKWNEILNRQKPSLIISTPGFSGVPINDLGVMIIERENSNSYRTKNRPYFDLRFFLEKYAENAGAILIIGDLILRTETLSRYDQQEFFEHAPIKFRSITDATQKLIDLKDKFEIAKNEDFISETLKRKIENWHQKNEHTLLLVNRRGVSPIIICNDCGTIVKCEHCSSAMVLHGKDIKEEGNHLKCHNCGSQRETDFICKNCGGWRLVTLGVGTEKIAEYIKNLFPDSETFILDKDHAPNPNKAKSIVQNFYDSPNGILIGTEMSLLYLHQQIENVGIISIDSLFLIPDFRIRERILNILLRARSIASQDFVIQTRNSEEKIFKNIIEGNLTDFYRQEFIDRKRFNYPPFSLIIKISLTAKNMGQIEKQFEALQNFIGEYQIRVYPAFVESVRGMKIMRGMIKIDRKDWPNQNLIEKLQNLPPQFKVEIDAESVL
ncbi:MAG TPA: primosomal protein N' [Candidatus Paceibacterota bacterium]|nr:primosomal protein N' [Candidatus Paceibacterota bacterium]HMP18869.1 primosomal protein N' [Candidatus Paceibacterota bacterium]HMP85167.1 primosomal protein N' [Candidatus Paceibacterota bacterium]